MSLDNTHSESPDTSFINGTEKQSPIASLSTIRSEAQEHQIKEKDNKESVDFNHDRAEAVAGDEQGEDVEVFLRAKKSPVDENGKEVLKIVSVSLVYSSYVRIAVVVCRK